MSTEQVKANTLKKLMESAKKEIEAALPKHVTPERMMRIALTEARKNPDLLACDQGSFLGAVIQASQLGLEPGGALGHCYLIPFNNRKENRKEVQFMIGYRGMLNLAMRSEKVSHVSSRAVHEGDEFSWEFGLNEGLVHKPTGSGGALTHVYAVVFLKNGVKMFDVMTRAEVEKIRDGSKASEYGPWKTHLEEMAKKTVIRRLFKYMPTSIELDSAVGLDELADAGESQGNTIATTSRPVNAVNDLQDQLHGQSGQAVHQDTQGPKVETEFDKFQGSTVVTTTGEVVKE